MSEITVRNVLCDFYLDKPNPFSKHLANSASRLPVIRLFGILDSGQKCCVHIHGVFPYFLVGFDTYVSQQNIDEFGSFVRNLIEGTDSSCIKEQATLYTLETISTKSIYGYHKDAKSFVKVSFFSPYHRNKVIYALQQGSFSKSAFQLYEAHVPYLLQFYIDYSLFGMDLVHFKAVKYRISPQANASDTYVMGLTVGKVINDTSILSPLLPSTSVAVECDAFACDIANAEHCIDDKLSNPGLRYIWRDEERRCSLRGVSVEAGLSQDKRYPVVNDVENGWLKRLRDISRTLRTLVKQHYTPSTCKPDSTLFNDSLSELDSSVLFSLKENGEQPLASGDDEDEEEVWSISETNYLYNTSDVREDEETIEMSQALSTLYVPTGHVIDAGSSSSCRTDDNFGEEVSADSPAGENELLRVSPDLFDNEETISGPDKNSGFVGKGSYQGVLSDVEDTLLLQNKCKRTTDSSENPNSGPPTKTMKCQEKTNKSERRSCFVPCGQLITTGDNSDQIAINSAYLYKTEVRDVATLNYFEKTRSSQTSSTYSVPDGLVKRHRSYKRLDDGNWLTPSYLLPLRQPTDDIQSTTECEGAKIADSTSAALSMSTQHSSEPGFLDSLVAESWCEPSFLNYSASKDKLEATAVLPDTPKSNPDKAEIDIRDLCVLSVEILCSVQDNQRIPDPKSDAILGIFCCVSVDVCVDTCPMEQVCFLYNTSISTVKDPRLHCFGTEDEMLDAFVGYLKKIDPDIVIGYSALKDSWGYLVERSLTLSRNLLSEISRYRVEVQEYWNPEQPNFHFDPRPRGRILMNVWKLLRNELSLRSYTLSSVVQAVLGKRFPEFAPSTMAKWMLSENRDLMQVAVRHKLLSAKLSLQVLCQLDFFTRVAEMARVYGIQFSEVLSRGSQFRVESMLLRLARLKQLAAATVSPAQRSAMPSPETLPLTMEPKSGLYRDPVIVLDFQSLYPSVIIAYNYCFSTCLGRISEIEAAIESGDFEHIRIGALKYSLPVHELMRMLKNDELHVSPVGGIFCKKSVLKGITPILLEEILDTRIMVKNAVKVYKDNLRLSRILDARQLALKLIANVTYGYSAANFSGRMPCVEVADAIVSKGRETLEKAIARVNSGAYGSARVIYGDTDSMFVVCPGSSREEAFEIGKRIANDVTLANPSPMKLKLEKVMHPLILETKKRYVGISYESSDEKDGTFDAKGIETVRRDSCPLVSRILENALRLLFNNHVSLLIRYLDTQLSNLDRLPLTDFTFSREYRKHYSDKAVVPAKMIAEKRRSLNPRDEPEAGERLSYLIVAGPPEVRLITCVREPWEFVREKHLYINYDYYVHRQVLPSLHRALETLPIRFSWHRPISGDCYGCKAAGVRNWCDKCGNERKPFYSALCNFFVEREVQSQLDRVCANCIAAQVIHGDLSLCKNLSCAVVASRIQISRTRTTDALKAHNLSDLEIKRLF